MQKRRLFILFGIAITIGSIIIIRQEPAVEHPPTGIVVRHSEYVGWIEVWKEGELASEWRKEDGEIFEFLRSLISDESEPMEPVEIPTKFQQYV